MNDDAFIHGYIYSINSIVLKRFKMTSAEL